MYICSHRAKRMSSQKLNTFFSCGINDFGNIGVFVVKAFPHNGDLGSVGRMKVQEKANDEIGERR